MSSASVEEADANRGEFCRVHIRVLCRARHGQSVGVAGLRSLSSAPSVLTATAGVLQAEDRERDPHTHAHTHTVGGAAIKLVTTPETYPIWHTAAPLVLPRNALLQYKYCLIEGGNVKAFERRSAPRTVRLREVEAVLEDEFSLAGLADHQRLFGDLHSLRIDDRETDRERDAHTHAQREASQIPPGIPKPPGTGSPRASPLVRGKERERERARERERESDLVRWSHDNRLRAERERELLTQAQAHTQTHAETERDAHAQSEGAQRGTEYLRYAIARQSRLLLICYHLPVSITRRHRDNDNDNDNNNNNSNSNDKDNAAPLDVQWAESIIAKTAGSVSLSLSTIWVGTLPISVSSLTAEEREYLEQRLREMNCVPVYLDDNEAHRAYHGFCKTILWPVFHNVDQLDQIHAAWNLPADYQKNSSFPTQMAPNAQQRSRSNSYSLTFSPLDTEVHKDAQGDRDSAVLEWNKASLSLQAAYRQVNRIFADTVLSLAREGDILWVHDYHLMLVPSMLRAALQSREKERESHCRDAHVHSQASNENNESNERENNDGNENSESTSTGEGLSLENPEPSEADNSQTKTPTDSNIAAKGSFKIIFFLHIPFPTSQIFRTLPASLELLESLVCADLVGFHAFDHARHFLNAAKRMLGLRAHTRPGGMLLLSVQDREVILTMSHVSIETDRADEVLSRPLTQSLTQSMRERFAGMKVVAGIDVCQRLSGVALKLAGFEKFALDFLSQPDRAQGVVLVQRVYRPGSRPEDEETTARDLSLIVAQLNAKFAQAALSHKHTHSHTTTSHTSSHTPSAALTGESVRSYHESDKSDLSVKSMLSDQSGYESSESFSARFEGTSPLNVTDNNPTPIPQSGPSDVLRNTFKPVAAGSAHHTAHSSSQHAHTHNGIVSEEEAYRIARTRQGVFIDFQVVDASGPEESERFSLYLSSDLLLLTPIREGLNVLPLEYVYARRTLPRGGAVCVSEFSTCSSLLNGALKINPFSPLSVADAIEKALHMSVRECEYRRQRDLPFIVAHPSSLWTKQIVNELEQVSACASPRLSLKTLTRAQPLCEKALLQAYMDAKRDSGITPTGSRVFILDYGGALLHREKFDIYMKQTLSAIAGRRPSPSMMETVRRLSEDPHNIVLVVTGLTRLKLGSTFKELRNVALATSNGLIYSWGDRLNGSTPPPKGAQGALLPQDSDSRHWSLLPQCTQTISDWNAINEIAAPIISKFTFRTNGTCKTPRFPGTGWSYFGADPEWGSKQAAQLKLELEAALANFDVKITSLVPGSIEVVPRTLRKGLVVSECLRRVVAMRGGRPPSLVTVFGAEEPASPAHTHTQTHTQRDGDDGTSQALFDALRDTAVVGELRNTRVFNIAVGRERESPAQLYVNDIACVERVLRSLADTDY